MAKKKKSKAPGHRKKAGVASRHCSVCGKAGVTSRSHWKHGNGK